ncbi:hypothetical protein [Chryseobacterium polytrichastri]|uniref:Immunity protein 35 n=1 Tax=Chryseobacterium polytrichastri TaxID=1302687 RepID=A0A1M7AES2_9FLAO|nr:hypothetical protein [Chryseobacterium polytrichastri]SHL41212.1 hypothetical protein SAMN05444267_101768 [Chryseobacterium polytrichastri]
MLTDQEMLIIAERYLKSKAEHFGGSDIEVVILTEETIKKPYGNIYDYQSKEYILTGNFNKSLVGNSQFLVEKKYGRVVGFGTADSLESYIQDYENETMTPSLDLYWYPDEDRFDYK